MRRAALAILLSSCLATAANAQLVPPQNSKPEPTPKTDTILPARDVMFPGTMQLTVDASDNVRGIFRIHQHVPSPQRATLYALSKVGSWRSQPPERHQECDWISSERERTGPKMGSGHPRRVRVSHRCSTGRQRDRPRL